MNKQIATYLLLPVLVLLLFSSGSCKKKKDEFNMYYDYFPQTKGKYVVYAVTDIYIDIQVNQKDTFHYFIKTEIGDTLVDNSGRIVKEFIRYKATNQNGPWTVKDVWTTVIDGGRGELVEENNRVIKLVFAPSEDDEWNMNAFNTLEEKSCFYSGIHVPYQLGSLSFQSTVTVEQEDFQSYIDDRRKFEVYALGVGMVYKYYKHNEIIGGNKNNIKKGREISMKALAFG